MRTFGGRRTGKEALSSRRVLLAQAAQPKGPSGRQDGARLRCCPQEDSASQKRFPYFAEEGRSGVAFLIFGVGILVPLDEQ